MTIFTGNGLLSSRSGSIEFKIVYLLINFLRLIHTTVLCLFYPLIKLLAYCSEANSYTDLWAQLLDSASSKVSTSCSSGARLLSARASQAYVETVFYVRGDLTAGKRNRLTKNLELHAFLKVNLKYYAQFWLGCSR